MHRPRALILSALVLLSACDGSSAPADATADVTPDATSDATTDNPADTPLDRVPADVQFPCPSGSLDPVFSQPCAGFEGAECRYGYTIPGCGGRTQRCVGGRWDEEHTDPQPSCFDAGADVVDASPGDAGNVCLAAGGICLGRSGDCTGAGGTVVAAGAAGCRFSDGDGVCCAPPEAQPSGDTCAAHGGLCAPIAGCNFVGGSFAPPSCTGVGIVCCVARAVCGPETRVCCAPGGSASFRPACDRGTFRCTVDGTELMPTDRCP